MLQRIRDNVPGIIALCKQFDVKRLELFGSAARDNFDPASSDLDFFIEFRDYTTDTIADQWFGFKEALGVLLNAEIDLTSLRSTANPYFLQVANRDRVPLYALRREITCRRP